MNLDTQHSSNTTALKTIFAILGSASTNSANEKLLRHLAHEIKHQFQLTIFDGLKTLPHFDPELSVTDPPPSVVAFRTAIEKADGVLICTPEYVFSVPSGLKNAIEWCVATTVFTDKPTALITASAHGQKGHEELQLLMQTLSAKFTGETTLLINGIKGKITASGEINDAHLKEDLHQLTTALMHLIGNNSPAVEAFDAPA